MRRMFEQALVDFPQHRPKALSSDPYVLQFEDMVTAEEADEIVGRCTTKFERSMAGDQVSPVRTSSQCWCDDANGDCTWHPSVVALTERMLNITKLPTGNAEYLQILKYEPGQFYKVHHDQRTLCRLP